MGEIKPYLKLVATTPEDLIEVNRRRALNRDRRRVMMLVFLMWAALLAFCGLVSVLF